MIMLGIRSRYQWGPPMLVFIGLITIVGIIMKMNALHSSSRSSHAVREKKMFANEAESLFLEESNRVTKGQTPITTELSSTSTLTTELSSKLNSKVENKFLTLGMAVKLPHRNISSFLTSLAMAAGTNNTLHHVVLFGDQATITALSPRYPNVEWVLDQEQYTFHPSNQRYFMYGKYVDAHVDAYSHIQVADVRDTVFLRDPFETIDLSNGLVHVFMEEANRRIAAGDFNTQWVKQCYGTAVLREIGSNVVSCSGYVLGTSKAVQEYLGLMTTELETHRSCESNGIDQGIHNVLLRKHKPSLFTMHANQHEVFTLGYMAKGVGTLTAIERDKPTVLHQYDRHPLLIPWVLKLTASADVVDTTYTSMVVGAGDV